MRSRFLLSVPERIVRSVAALAGGLVHESAQILLPRLVRRSRLYEASAKNLLRVTIELVGGVEGASTAEPGGVGQLAVRKGAGNIIELGSIAAFGFSPLWLLAAASDVARGSRVYLDALVGELKAAGVLAPGAEIASVDELLGALERGSGTAARLVDIPPLELAELRSSVAELRSNVGDLPSPDERGRVRGPAPHCPGGGTLAARGLCGNRPRLPALGSVAVAGAPRRAVSRGLAPDLRRGLRGVCASGRTTVRACRGRPFRSEAGDVDGARARAARPQSTPTRLARSDIAGRSVIGSSA